MQISQSSIDRLNASIDQLQVELGGPPKFAIVMQQQNESEADAMLRAEQQGAAMTVLVRRFCELKPPPEP